MLHNLKSYKLAKVLVKDLSNMIIIMKDYEIKMSIYKKYSPVKKMLANLVENRKIVEYHLNKQKAILENRGLEEEQKLLEKPKND